eukprot:363973-Chlamydomonas_euryale.AAC.12
MPRAAASGEWRLWAPPLDTCKAAPCMPGCRGQRGQVRERAIATDREGYGENRVVWWAASI